MAKFGNLTMIPDESLDNNCTVCERQGKITKSGVFCFECQTYLCADCVSTHNIFCIGHHVLKTTDEKVQNILTERCEKHPDKVIEFYCRNHDEVVCTTCYLLNHKKCDDVKHIGESVAELSADPDIQAIPGQIDSALDHVNQIIETFDKHIKHIESDKNKFLEDLEEFAKSILSKIEEMRKRGKDDLTASHQRITFKANEKLNACVQAKNDLGKYLDEIKRSSKRNAHLIVLKNRIKKIAIQSETLCNESKQMIKGTEFCFRRNNRLSGLLAGFNSLLEESTDHMEQLTLHFNTSSTIEDEKRYLQRQAPEDISLCEAPEDISLCEAPEDISLCEAPEDISLCEAPEDISLCEETAPEPLVNYLTDKEEMVHGSFSQPQDEKPSSRRQFGVSNSDEIRIKNQPAYFEPIKSPLSQPQGEVSIPQQQVQGHFSQPQRWSPCPQQQNQNGYFERSDDFDSEISPASPVPIKFDWEYEEEPF